MSHLEHVPWELKADCFFVVVFLANTFQSRRFWWFCVMWSENAIGFINWPQDQTMSSEIDSIAFKSETFSFHILCLYHVFVISSFLLLNKYLETYIYIHICVCIYIKYIYICIIQIFSGKSLMENVGWNNCEHALFQVCICGWLWVFSFDMVTYWFYHGVNEGCCQLNLPAHNSPCSPIC